jgi:hypothetical protein
MSAILASQLVAVTDELPQYRAAIWLKLEKIRELTERPFARIEAKLSAVSNVHLQMLFGHVQINSLYRPWLVQPEQVAVQILAFHRAPPWLNLRDSVPLNPQRSLNNRFF